MAVETIEISGKVRQVTTNKVTVKRTASGLTLTVESPEIHKWLQDTCELRNLESAPRAGWPREGKVLHLKRGDNRRLPPCLSYYSHDVVLLDDDSVNLSILKHESAAEGPVSFTVPGVFSFETAQRILQRAQDTIASLFRDHMREYSGTATIKIVK